jgi:hypothetical protein
VIGVPEQQAVVRRAESLFTLADLKLDESAC